MEDSPAANPKEYMRRWFPDSSNLLVEPRSHDLIPRADTAAFTFDLPELEAQFDNDPGAFSEWCQFPGDQMDFSSQVTTKHRTDHLQILDQPPHDKNASGSHVQQHEPRMILPNFGAASAEMLSPNQNTLLVDEPWNGCSYVFDVPQIQHAARAASLPEGSASDASWTPPSIESGTVTRQNPEQVVRLKKRHLGTRDGESYPPKLVHSKRQKTAAYDCPNKDQVGEVEASFFEDWLSKFPDVYPGPEQFVLLAGLTKLRTETVQSWFSKRLRNGSRSTAFANLLMEPSAATEAPSASVLQMSLIQQPPDRTLDKAKLEASNWVREHKAKKCRKRGNPKNFVRDLEKPYCCTLGCGTKFKDKDDWRKHEERNYPQGGWICDLGSIVQFDGRTLCAFCGILNPKTEHGHGKVLCSEKKVGARGRLHFRKQHFSQHFIRVHPGIPCDEYLENNHFTVKSKFPRRCGFCRYLSKHWRDRIEHIGGHFIAGKDMSQWDFGVEDDEGDQARSADHENSDGDGGFSRKRYRPPDDESGYSDDDSNDSPPKSAPKQRRRNTPRTYSAPRTCGLTQSRDANPANNPGIITHTHQESHSVPSNDSFPGLYLPSLECGNISHKPSSITASIMHSTSNNKLTQPSATKAVLKRIRTLLSDKCRLFTVMVEVKAIERSSQHRMSHFLRACENSAHIHLRTNLCTRNDLVGLIQSYASTLIPSVEAIARWCKLLASGNLNLDTQSTISVARYASEISEKLSAKLSADISSLASLLLGIWRLLIDDDRTTCKSLLTALFSSSALCHENFAQFQEWIDLLRKNGHVMRTRVARKAPHAMLAVQKTDTSLAVVLPSHLHSDVNLQPIGKPPVLVVENQDKAFPITIDTISGVSVASRVHLASDEQDISGGTRCHAPISHDDFTMPIVKSITWDTANATATFPQTALTDETFRKEMPDYSLSSRSNNLSSLFAAEAPAPSRGVQYEFYDSGIGSSLDPSWNMLRNSFLGTVFDDNNSNTDISSSSASIVNYASKNEPSTGLPFGETWLQSTAPWDVTSATPTTALDSTSLTFPNVDGHDLSSVSGIWGPWSSIAGDLGLNTPPFLSLELRPDSTEYSHTSVSSNSYKTSESWNYNAHNQMKRRRKSPLSLEGRKNAALVRALGACWLCRVRKLQCDMGTTCAPCARRIVSPLESLRCVRTRISDYTDLFLPDTITSRYSETAIRVAIRHQIGGFTNNQIEVLMSTGSAHPPLAITVHEYIPPSCESLQPRHASLVKVDDIHLQNNCSDSPPLVLLRYDPAEVKDKLLRHVKAVIEIPPDISEAISGETWIVSYKTFEAVNKYRRASDTCEKDRILELALELRTMHYIMSRPIVIEPSSASQAFSKLQGPHVLPYNKEILNSNIINLQLKHEMIVLLRETTAKVLRGLERTLHGTQCKHATWSAAFCLVIVVCSCIEAVQISVDATTVVKMQKAEMITPDTSRAKHCQELEQVVFDHVKNVFIYTYRIQRNNGCNPIRDGLELNKEKGITLPMVELVRDMRRIIEEHKDDINNRAKDLEFETEPAKTLEDHWRLRKRLSGRMVSKFLKALYS